jgi:formate hydrogenlyase subunit 3/multisubunit Na+/H+ antiporter MnhD subunit
MMILPFNLLQNKMNNPSLQGLFFLMPKSCILLIISILNLIGLTPSFNMINNYQILKNLSDKMTIISLSTIVFFNFFIMVFLCVFLKLIFTKVSIDRNQEDINLINTFENEQNLVFSRIAVIILSIVFFLFRKFFIL